MLGYRNWHTRMLSEIGWWKRREEKRKQKRKKKKCERDEWCCFSWWPKYWYHHHHPTTSVPPPSSLSTPLTHVRCWIQKAGINSFTDHSKQWLGSYSIAFWHWEHFRGYFAFFSNFSGCCRWRKPFIHFLHKLPSLPEMHMIWSSAVTWFHKLRLCRNF